jgi:excisionase family DNA binding protein
MVNEFEWRPGEDFHEEPIEEVFGKRVGEITEHHRILGPQFAWEVPAGQGEVTRIELFPERGWATIIFVDGSLQKQKRELALDYLAVRTVDSRTLLSLVAAQDDRGTLINVYPTGEIDEHFRLLPPSDALPSEALLFKPDDQTPDVSIPLKEWPALTVEEAAVRLGFGAENVRRLLREGKLDGFKRGGAWYIPTDSIITYDARKKPSL